MPIRPRQSRLFTVPDWTSGHQTLYLPWLRDRTESAASAERPSLVVAPTRGNAYFLKSTALNAGLNLFGLHFLTPLEVRDRLRRTFSFSRALPLREHLHLFLAAAAERDQNPTGSTVAAAPDHLLKVIDLLGAGGWSFSEAGPASLRGIVREFEQSLHRCEFELIHDTDRALLAVAPERPAVFSSVYITGFDGAHWPLWPLLAATAHTADDATIALHDPRTEAQELDTTWVGTWEQEFAAAEPLSFSDTPRPFEDILRAPESPGETTQRAAHPVPAIEFLIGQNTTEQARAVVQQALHFLADPACTRLGILLPGSCALARTVAELLADLAIPHNDGLAHLLPGPFETAEWPIWLELQTTPRLPVLLRFLRVFPRVPDFFDGLEVADIEDGLRRAFKELLIDDLAVLAEWLARSESRPNATALARGLRAFPQLPAQASFARFVAASADAFARMGWTDRADELARLTRDWATRFDPSLTRRTFLRWLGEILVSTGTERAAIGNHPYARTQLLPYPNAEMQTWTHLIVTGLNEGRWPPSFEEGGWLDEDEINALNTRAITQGRQGEGHATAQAGRALCLGPAQRRALGQRQFAATLEAASAAIAATAQLFDEANPDRQLNPSDFLTRLYFCTRGKSLSQTTMTALREETGRWIDAGQLWKTPPRNHVAAGPTRRAYAARRDAAQPFGEYEFALRSPLAKPVRLAATTWERALSAPALVWMEHLLGVAAREAESDPSPWLLAIGQWSHSWLRAISGTAERNTFAPLPAPDEIVRRVRNRAAAFHAHADATLQSCGRPPPDWWISLWQQATQITGALAQRVAAVRGPTHIATEWKLAETAVANGLNIHGRLDLILASSPSATAAPWIVDYKTGRKKSLRPSSRTLAPPERIAAIMKRLRQGDGLQLALYALALRQLGAPSFGLSLLTPDLHLDEPQLTEADLPADDPLWRGLHAMQEHGRFGMRGELRSEFSFNDDYPLATLAIDAAVLDEKWARTHPDLATAEEGAP